MPEEFRFVDWSKLKTSMIIIGSCCIVFLAGVCTTYYQYSVKNAELKRLNVQLDQQRATTRQAKIDLETALKYEPAYQGLVTTGFVGDEDRLSWVETFKMLTERNLIPSTTFTISRRTDASPSQFVPDATGISLSKSDMTLSFQLLHEGDFKVFFDQLKQEAKGLYTLNECDLANEARKNDLSVLYNLVGNCQMSWYTVKENATQMPNSPQML